MRIFIILLLWACSFSVLAGLGGSQAALGPSSRSSATAFGSLNGPNYTVVQTVLVSGTEIHEYVDAKGVVFAVSWSGPFLPDLQQLLGAHFKSLVDQEQKQSGRGHSHVGVQQADVIIYSGGRMGAFEGRAWIPAMLPSGFETSEIR